MANTSYPIFSANTGQFVGFGTAKPSPSAATNRLPGTTAVPKYPLNASFISKSGIEVQYDDTPGHERVRIAHPSGTYYEISSDGRKVEVVKTNDYKYVQGNLTLTVDQNGDVKLGGSLRIIVGGDAHIEVKKNATLAIGGNLVATIGENLEAHTTGSAIISAGEKLTAYCQGDMVASVGGDFLAAISGSSMTSVSGESCERVMGNKTLQVDGSYTIVANGVNIISKADIIEQAQGTISLTATNGDLSISMNGDNTTIKTHHLDFIKD